MPRKSSTLRWASALIVFGLWAGVWKLTFYVDISWWWVGGPILAALLISSLRALVIRVLDAMEV